MNMEYIQSTGDFYINGSRVYTGFSGAPGYINDPESQCLADRGPLPRGWYKMTGPEHSVTKKAIRLTPIKGTEMCGRFGMLIHGDSIENPGTGSKGCIILPLIIRERILQEIEDGNSKLEVR